MSPTLKHRNHPAFEQMSPSDTGMVLAAARTLQRAAQCQGMPPALLQRLGADAGVPVYDGLASPHHPTGELAELLGGDTTPGDNRRFVLQAVLLSSIA